MSEQQMQQEFPREKIIRNAILEFHTAPKPFIITSESAEPEVLNLFAEDINMSFGIIKITIADTPMITQEQVIDTSTDISGSMNDTCSDGRTKMQHATHTLKNIITTLCKKTEANITMATYGFDDHVEPIIIDTKLTQDNAEQLRNELNHLQPRGSTDIYKSLQMQKTRAENRRYTNQWLHQTNITLTDGQANMGISTLYSVMSEQVAPNCSNIFIGFGKDHNASGLQQLANAQPNGSYFYIAEIEKASLVFGEIIHQLIYTALTDIIITMSDAEIYDYKTNLWQNQLHISSIVSEATKTYHIRSATPDKASAQISACSAIHNEVVSTLIETNITCPPPLETDGVPDLNHLEVFMLRQRTQELIFKAHEHSLSMEYMYMIERNHDEEYYPRRERGKEIKKYLTQHYTFMQQYAIQAKLEKDELLSSLITDIAIILQTFGGAKATMYSAARGDSQGRQTSNNVSHINPEDMTHLKKAPKLMRRSRSLTLDAKSVFINAPYKGCMHDDVTEDEDISEDDFDEMQPILMSALSQTNTTPKQKELMRDLSMGCNPIHELDDEDEVN